MNQEEQLDMIFSRSSDEYYEYRKLDINDYEKGYMELLSQLTLSPKCTKEEWINRFNEINNNPIIDIIVIESIKDQQVIGTISMIFEPKFFRNLGIVCHIEDVVVDKLHRINRHGSKLLKAAIEWAKIKDCYKVILDCDEEVSGFYEKQGFSKKSIGMSIYFKKS